MTIRARVTKLEAEIGSGGLSLATRAWLGERLSPAERGLAEIEAAQPLPELDWNTMPAELREWWMQR